MGRAPGRVSACEAVGLIEQITGVLAEKQGSWESTEANLKAFAYVWALQFEEDIKVLERVGRREQRWCRVWTTSPVWSS